MDNRRPDANARKRNNRKGHLSEFLAALLLRAKGYKVLERRFRVRAGEIDIIACRNRRLAFVEVKARSELNTGLLALTASQRKRIINASQCWIKKHPYYSNFEINFDYIIVLPWKLPVHYKDYFRY